MKNFLLFFMAVSMSGLSGCDRGKCDCGPSPRIQELRFVLVDSTGKNLVNSISQINLYYMVGNTRTTVSDFSIYNNKEKDTLSAVTYVCRSGEAVDKSVAGIREFYLQLTPDDIDTVSIEATRPDDITRIISSVKFNGKECKPGGYDHAYAWLFVKQISK
jgi:hypothetical protein